MVSCHTLRQRDSKLNIARYLVLLVSTPLWSSYFVLTLMVGYHRALLAMSIFQIVTFPTQKVHSILYSPGDRTLIPPYTGRPIRVPFSILPRASLHLHVILLPNSADDSLAPDPSVPIPPEPPAVELPLRLP